MQKIFDDLLLYGFSREKILGVQQRMIEMVKKRFCEIHETPTKELTDDQKAELHALRRTCQQLGDVGYRIVRKEK